MPDFVGGPSIVLPRMVGFNKAVDSSPERGQVWSDPHRGEECQRLLLLSACTKHDTGGKCKDILHSQ